MSSVTRRFSRCARLLQNAAVGASGVTNMEGFNRLAKGTGRGPFIELPKFHPVGHPGGLLQIQLPASSTLNIRNGSIVALNGDLGKLNLFADPKSEFRVLEAMAPATMVMSGGRNDAYKVLEVSRENRWTVLRSRDITAWCGYDMELHRAKIATAKQAYATSGRGTLVVSGSSRLYEVELLAGEEMDVVPESLVAIRNQDTLLLTAGGSYMARQGWSRHLRLPDVVKVTTRSWKLAISRQWRQLVTSAGMEKPVEIISRGLRSIGRLVNRQWKKMWAPQAYFQVVGPATLLLRGSE